MSYRKIKKCRDCDSEFVSYAPNGKRCDPCRVSGPPIVNAADRRNRATYEGQACVYCGLPADTVDHVIPLSKGGDDTDENRAPACKRCNSSKGKLDLDEWLCG